MDKPLTPALWSDGRRSVYYVEYTDEYLIVGSMKKNDRTYNHYLLGMDSYERAMSDILNYSDIWTIRRTYSVLPTRPCASCDAPVAHLDYICLTCRG